MKVMMDPTLHGLDKLVTTGQGTFHRGEIREVTKKDWEVLEGVSWNGRIVLVVVNDYDKSQQQTPADTSDKGDGEGEAPDNGAE